MANFEREASLVLRVLSGASTLSAWFAENDETKEIMDELNISNPVHPDNLQWALREFVKAGHRAKMTQPVSGPSYNIL
jgi:hypothetical protein